MRSGLFPARCEKHWGGSLVWACSTLASGPFRFAVAYPKHTLVDILRLSQACNAQRKDERGSNPLQFLTRLGGAY